MEKEGTAAMESAVRETSNEKNTMKPEVVEKEGEKDWSSVGANWNKEESSAAMESADDLDLMDEEQETVRNVLDSIAVSPQVFKNFVITRLKSGIVIKLTK